MKIFLNETQVKLGDLISFNGIITPLTQEILDLNKDKFSILEEPKEKTLEDYENLLLNNQIPIYFNNIEGNELNIILKKFSPKLYWLKLFSLIAKDLNGGWKPDYNTPKWFILRDYSGEYKPKLHSHVMYDLMYFKSPELARKAIDIMGKYIGWVC